MTEQPDHDTRATQAARTRRRPAPPPAVERATAHVRSGGLLVLPTDTVYGIGALARDAGAVARLLAAKGRGRRMPPPVLVAGVDQLDGVVAGTPPAARALSWDLGETGGTIAVRMPDHPLTLALLRATGPMAVTSANRTGRPPATDAASARAAFPSGGDGPGDIVVLDGGPTPGPVPSTIVSLAANRAEAPVVLRDGVLSRAALAAVLRAAGAAAPAGAADGERGA